MQASIQPNPPTNNGGHMIGSIDLNQYLPERLHAMQPADLVQAITSLKDELKETHGRETLGIGQVSILKAKNTECERAKDALLVEKINLEARFRKQGGDDSRRNSSEVDSQLKFKEREVQELKKNLEELRKQLQKGEPVAPSLLNKSPEKVRAESKTTVVQSRVDSLGKMSGAMLLRVLLSDSRVMEALLHLLRTPTKPEGYRGGGGGLRSPELHPRTPWRGRENPKTTSNTPQMELFEALCGILSEHPLGVGEDSPNHATSALLEAISSFMRGSSQTLIPALELLRAFLSVSSEACDRALNLSVTRDQTRPRPVQKWEAIKSSLLTLKGAAAKRPQQRSGLEEDTRERNPLDGLLPLLFDVLEGHRDDPNISAPLMAILKLLASHCPRAEILCFEGLLRPVKLGIGMNSNLNGNEVTMGSAIDLLRICLSNKRLYLSLKEEGHLGRLLSDILTTCIQVPSVREASVFLFSSLLAHEDAIEVLIGLTGNTADETKNTNQHANFFIPRFVMLLDVEIAKGEQKDGLMSYPLVKEAVMILSAISKRVNLGGLLNNMRSQLAQATNKLHKWAHRGDGLLLEILPTIMALHHAVDATA